MSDWIRNDNENENEVPQTPSAPVEPTVPPVETPPAAPPYVPPQAPPYAPPQVPPQTPPVPPYRQQTYYTGQVYPSQPPTPPQPPVQPTPPSKPEKPSPVQKQKRTERVLIIVLSVVCALSLISSFILGTIVLKPKDEESNDSSVVTDEEVNGDGPTLQITDLQEIDDGGLPAREIVDKNLDATVVLTMYHKNSTFSSGYGSYFDYFDDFYGDFYGGNTGDYYDDYDGDSLTQASAASGIVMTEDGYIITNSHCVFDEEYLIEYARIDVTLYDGTVYEGAEIIGYDRSTDLAVIKINATGLTPAEFGDSSALSLGDRVITLGNSGGLSWSASQGILSGQARDVYEDTGYAIKCLQVDAVINPGSSGGPLLNAYGQVVGVNSAKIVLTGYEGLGFSIPINEAKTIIDDLIQHGYATGRVSLGIAGRTVTSIGYEGFVIEEINENSAFKGTKVQVGDIITHINGVRVMNYEEMRAELTKYEVGETISVSLIRLDRQTRKVSEFTVKVKLVEMR